MAKVKPVPLVFGEFEAGEEIARVIIPKYHPGLATARIRFICRNKATKKAGHLIPGNVYKMAPKYEYLIGYDFVLEIALEVWNDFNPRQRRAVVDHLLSRCIGDEDEENGEMKWKLRPPQVQEFPEIVERHGQWNEDLVDMGRSIRSTLTAEELPQC